MTHISSKKLLTLVLTINEERKEILLGMKKRGFGVGKFNGFGGKVEKGETIEQAARRELWEECEIKAIDLKKVGILMFTFENNPIGLETHVYTTYSYEGIPKETEEMKPEWFPFDQIPFDKMWSDDKYWFPFLFKQQLFSGHFHFAEDQKSILKYDLKPATITLKGFEPEQVII
ncbi:NUDIX hydrolase domain-like protein [Cokeromyces recurvatus]|uniref:NUDIX hydrolase domain-like protein n=1 Tax=Cokeromyces recurvatus TaxID=90255 RepID=UPI00221FCAE9|nr:NUDIX hydrolase domain-like protein [Cokeromyces recurvatus]KAI7902182.1 NUDIX hydrolase domain-like protein [Cokeromyces recurvatus]